MLKADIKIECKKHGKRDTVYVGNPKDFNVMCIECYKRLSFWKSIEQRGFSIDYKEKTDANTKETKDD